MMSIAYILMLLLQNPTPGVTLNTITSTPSTLPLAGTVAAWADSSSVVFG